ncbi:unnamed protein product [Caretta caretta]
MKSSFLPPGLPVGDRSTCLHTEEIHIRLCRKSIRPCSSTNIHAIRFHCRTRHERLFLRLIDAVILREEHVQTDLEDGEEKFCDQDEISEDKVENRGP